MIFSEENVVPPKPDRAVGRDQISKEQAAMSILTVALVLALAAFLVTIASAMGRAPLWVAVLLLAVLALVKVLPPR